MKRLLLLFLFLSFQNGVVAEAATGSKPNPIKIGYVTDLSGKGAFWGKQGAFGAQLAADELKAKGRDVEVIIGDHKMDAKTALTEAERLIQVNRVDALLSDFTPTSIAASGVANKAKKLFVYMSPAISILKTNPFSFKSFLDYKQGCADVARYFKDRGLKKIAALKIDLEFGDLCVEGAKSVIPDLIVEEYNSGDDLRPALLAMKKKGVQAILHTAYEVDMLNRLRIMGELHYHVPVGVPEPLMSEMVVKKGGKNLDDTVVFGFPTVSDEFIRKVRARDADHELTGIEGAAAAYTHVMQMASAISSCRARTVFCAVRKLSNVGYNSALGFEGWKDRIAQYDYTLRKWTGDDYVALSEEKDRTRLGKAMLALKVFADIFSHKDDCGK